MNLSPLPIASGTMKQAFSLLIIFASFTSQSISQNQGKGKIDSLFAVLKTCKADTTKVNTLNALANEFRNKDPKNAIYLANEAIVLAVRLNYRKGIADSYLYTAIALTHFNEYNEAMKKTNYALALYDHLLSSENKTNKTKILKQKSRAYHNLGNIFTVQSNWPEALKNIYASLKIREEIGDKQGIADSYNNLGVIYVSQGNYPEALKNYSASLKIYQEVADRLSISRSYTNMGVIYYDQTNYPEALDHFFSALKIVEETSDKKSIAIDYMNIANVYDRQRNYPLALENFFTALKISEEIDDKTVIAHVCHNIGVIYITLKKTNEASFYLNKGLKLAKEIGSLDNIKESYRDLSALDIDQGKLRQALDDYKMYVIFHDSIYSVENTEKLVQAQMQYESDKKESINKAEQEKKDAITLKELQRQKLLRNGFFGGFAVVLLFAGVFFRQRNKISKTNKRIEAEKERSEGLLLNILPAEVATELKQTGRCQAKTFSMVTVMFMDFKDFTNVSEKVSAELLVGEINFCFSAFDGIIQKYRVEKIKTVGDAYICVGGLPVLNYTHALDVVNTAIEIRDFMLSHKKEKEEKGEIPFELRIGIHTGSVVAGIVGVKKFQYDIWGDTVNLAARMEQNSEAGKINISGSTYQLVKDKFNCSHRGKIEAKNKGEVDMYFVESMT